MNSSSPSNKQKLSDAYRWFVVACGIAAVTFAAMRMPLPKLDLRFMLLVAVTMIVSSRFVVRSGNNRRLYQPPELHQNWLGRNSQYTHLESSDAEADYIAAWRITITSGS